MVQSRRGLTRPLRRSATGICVVGFCTALASCSSGPGSSVTTTTSGAAAAPTTTSTTKATAPTTTTTSAPAIPVAPQPTADRAANALISAWAAGNRPTALSVATAQSVATLFAVPYPAGLAIDRGCSVGAPSVTCSFGPPGGGNPNDALYSLTVTQAPGGWYVSNVQIEG